MRIDWAIVANAGGLFLGAVAILLSIFKAPAEIKKTESDVVGNFSKAASETVKSYLELQAVLNNLTERLEKTEDALRELEESTRKKDLRIQELEGVTQAQDFKIKVQDRRIQELEAEVLRLSTKKEGC